MSLHRANTAICVRNLKILGCSIAAIIILGLIAGSFLSFSLEGKGNSNSKFIFCLEIHKLTLLSLEYI